mgnify:CR=1 FL=1
MRKTYTIIILFCLLAMTARGDNQNGKIEEYHRSALATMMVYHPEDDMGYSIWTTFNSLPAPDKYDVHNTPYRCIDNSKITDVRLNNQVGLYRQSYGGTQSLSDTEINKNAAKINQLLNKASIANHLVAQWFNMQGDSLQNAYFNTDLLMSRSMYDVSAIDAEMSRYTVEGISGFVVDLSEDLLAHTFVLVNDITVRATAEDRGNTTKKIFGILGGIWDAVTGGNNGERLARDIGDIADNYSGYKIDIHSYLFKLIWNDSISNEFYTKYYTEKPNPKKMRAFWQDKDLFRLQYMGHTSNVAEKTSSQYSDIELLRFVTSRAIDKNIATLQKTYDDFKVRVPIVQVEYNTKQKDDCYRAPIGLKEGITDKTEFVVLECVFNEKTLKLDYQEVATVVPIKSEIWDNRFNAVQEMEDGANLTGTLFKCKSIKAKQNNIRQGMLIMQK